MADNINPDHYKRLPAEAIEIIELAIDKAPSNQDAYLHGQVLKYILRCWNKNGIEDLRKAKWYLDRLIDSFDESEAEQLATGEATVEVAGEVKPPDGWRWLEVGETLRRGDTTNTIDEIPETWIGTKCVVKHVALRRNRFNVGEIVVHVNGIEPCEVVGFDREKDKYWITSNGSEYAYESRWLAPYIEDAK